jgi:hypothetical protein
MLGAEFNRRFEEFRDNYARVLNVPESCIFFTNMNNPDRVEAVRCILYTRLRPQVTANYEGDLAMMLMHPEFMREIEVLQDRLSISNSELVSACTGFFKNNQHLSAERLEKFLVQTRDNLKNKKPRGFQRGSSLRTSRTLNLEGFLLQPLIEMGFHREVIGLIFELLSKVVGDSETGASTLGKPKEESPLATQLRGLMAIAAEIRSNGGDSVSQIRFMELMAPVLELVQTVDAIFSSFKGMGYPDVIVAQAIRKCFQMQEFSEHNMHVFIEEGMNAPIHGFSDITAGIAAFSTQGESILRGSEQLGLLKHGVAVSALARTSQRVHPKMVCSLRMTWCDLTRLRSTRPSRSRCRWLSALSCF